MALSGGVFQNRLLLEAVTRGVEAQGLKVHTNTRVPANDGGVSLGQASCSGRGCCGKVSGMGGAGRMPMVSSTLLGGIIDSTTLFNTLLTTWSSPRSLPAASLSVHRRRSCVPGHAASPPAPVPQTGQTACYGATGTAVIDCAGTGQDGETRTGAAWPDPRFAENGDQTIVDRLTGLVWTRDANPAGGPRTWQEALDYIKTLNGGNHLGQSDWRLPNVNELESLVNKQPNLAEWLQAQGFRNLQVDYYWTSTTYASYPRYAWSVGVYGGIVAGHDKADGYFVWPVRRGGAGSRVPAADRPDRLLRSIRHVHRLRRHRPGR